MSPFAHKVFEVAAFDLGYCVIIFSIMYMTLCLLWQGLQLLAMNYIPFKGFVIDVMRYKMAVKQQKEKQDATDTDVQ